MNLKLDDLVFLPTDEAEVIVLANLPTGRTLRFEDIGLAWQATVFDSEGEVRWTGVTPDKRILLFDAVGFLIRESGLKPQHPAWQRRREVEIPAPYGNKAHQATTAVPDPEDLNPSELLSIYGITPRNKDTIK